MNNVPYVDVETADAYHETRQSHDDWFALDDAEKLCRLTTASDFIDTAMRYIGKKADAAQGRQWPRLIPDAYGCYPDRALPLMPSEVLQAVCELALLENITGALSGSQKLSDVGAGILLKGGDCDGNCSSGTSARMAYAARLLEQWRVKNISVLRG